MAETFTVVGQRKTMGRGPDGQFGPVIEVSFRTRSGIVSSVDVPQDSYNVDTARQMIEEAAAHLEAVAQL